jgi:2-desacetyl-2-hydroxyethyl bacteriochlorophyllide A dehydrogenase
MKAAFCSAPEQFELRDLPRPIARAGEAVVKIRNCGVCGSDLHWYHGGFPIPPVCPGHEISGEVVEIGAGVGSVRLGDRVAIEPLIVCRECSYCRTGNYQLCRRFRVLGTMVNGGFAEYVAMPAYALFPLPSELGWDVGALSEPLAVCVHAVRLAGVRLGERVLVLGAGSIGLLAVVAARAAGAAEVLITARYPHQAAAAEALGGRPFATTFEDSARLSDFAREYPIDAVIETVGGAADTVNEAVQLVRPGGVVSVLGVFTGSVSCNGLLLVLKEVQIIGSLTYGRVGPRADFDVATDLLARDHARVRRLITHRFDLDRIGEAFATAADKRSGAIKVTITP